jgi:hypothetical protein
MTGVTVDSSLDHWRDQHQYQMGRRRRRRQEIRLLRLHSQVGRDSGLEATGIFELLFALIAQQISAEFKFAL